MAGGQAQRRRRLALAAGHRSDASAHHFGHERRGVEGQAQQHRDELGRERTAAVDRRLTGLGDVPGVGCAAQHPADQGASHDQRQRRQQHRPRPAGLLEMVARAARPGPGQHGAHQTTDKCQRLARAPHRHRKRQAALAQEDQAGHRHRLGRIGQPFGQQQVPDQQLQQHRHIAEQLDIAVAQATHDGVVGEPADADQRAQDRGQHDADDRHPQRVEHADQEGFPVGVDRLVRDHQLADVETRRVGEKVEPALDAAHPHVLDRVVRQEPDAQGDQAQRGNLVEQCAHGAAAQRPVAFFRWGSTGRHGKWSFTGTGIRNR